MKLSNAIANYIESCGVEYIFGIPSGNIASMYDAVNDTKMNVIITKNEAGATYSCAKYSDLTGKLSCAILCGGVGITNAINGICDAWRNNIPMLVISGYASTENIGKGSVQELDTTPITESITKYSKTVLDKNEVLKELDKAVKLAMQDPKGPVHISIPMNLPNFEIENFDEYKEYKAEKIDYNYDDENLNTAINILNESKKGFILVGRGAKGNDELIQKISSKLGWYCATTPQGKNSLNNSFDLNIGNYGFNSTDFAEKYADTEDFDCVLVLGSSLGESATRNFNQKLFAGKKVIQIDNSKVSLNKNHIEKFNVYYELSKALNIMNEKLVDKCVQLPKIENLNKEYVKDHTGISVRKLAEMLPSVLPPSTTYMCDIGEFMNYIYKNLFIPKEGDFIASLNYGAMGNCVAGSVGAALSKNTEKYAVIVGDGSFFMNGNEILTAKENSLPIIYFVINNARLNYVEQGSMFMFGRSTKGVVQERISIKALGEAAGIKSYQINHLKELKNIKEDLCSCNEPIIVEIITDGSEKVAAADRFKTIKNSCK